MRLFLITFCFCLPELVFCQSGYNIQFRIHGLKDTTVYLGHYYGESTYVKDTAIVGAGGEFIFTGKERLPQGIYFLILNKTRLPDLLIGMDQHFFVTTSIHDYLSDIVVRGDIDNELYLNRGRFNNDCYRQATPFLKILSDSSESAASKLEARVSFEKIHEKVNLYDDSIISKYPMTLTARIIKADRPIVAPKLRARNQEIDSLSHVTWYREHFFDDFDLADDALIRMSRPIYQQRVNDYLDKLWMQQPDTITKAVERIVSRAKHNRETYKYAVWICVVKYSAHEIMGLDEVFVNLYDRYFKTGEMNFWADEKLRKNLKDQADRQRKSLVGRTGANLIMQDIHLKPRSMYDITNKYTILFIFDPDCGHCRAETPKLVDLYAQKKFDLEVYAVSADTSMVKMREFIREMDMKWITVNGPRSYVGAYSDLYDSNTTPTVYILDRRKKIIAKKISIDQINDFLTLYEGKHVAR
jgi:hypothetical protein